ncbi:WS/DGAT/MGAT family O-acyltransferase [Pseudonocardia sp. GCM10023141]|uniref:WS/DGAT/MGAT family O-acyltransferase n=1 Tax=Pseudonocardia sp. GCM10023141 TaxID=3252653 RepID=UPI0036163102
MGLMQPVDAMFLIGESREHPMHVGGLQLFELPPGAGPDHVSNLYQELLGFTDLRPLMRSRPATPVSSLGQIAWADDAAVDLEYHVRLSALPRPGRVRELLELTSRMHGTLLDRHRPLWEFHLIEGLQDGRFATYMKVHHALVDGVSATRMLIKSLSETPDGPVVPLWAKLPESTGANGSGASIDPLGMIRSAVGAVGDIAGTLPVLAKLAVGTLRSQSDALPVPAPRTILNGPITGARRFAAQPWPIDRLKAAGAAAGATLNDVVLAMCAGALRRYLEEQGALPDKPLVAAVPVSLRAAGSTAAGGNEVGIVLCSLATDIADPHDRLQEIRASMNRAKAVMAGQTPLQIQAMTGMLLGLPTMLNMVPGLAGVVSMFNLIISNVPGSRTPLYWNGAKLQGTYPVSIPFEGQALNITVTSYNGAMQFGLTGCRRNVPHLQRMLTHLEDSLAELDPRG